MGLITNIGANKVNEVRAHYLPSHVRLTAFLQGTDYNAQFGVSGFSAQLRPGSGGSFPDYAWSGYASMQGSAFDQRPKSQDRKAVEGTENFTILKGRHSLKFGVLIRYYQWLGYDSQTYAGQFNFNGNASRRCLCGLSAGLSVLGCPGLPRGQLWRAADVQAVLRAG